MKTLLIVEDEKAIRTGLAAMAGRAGVPVGEVIECRNGAEAWALLQARPVDVMVTDIRMPKMDGIELVRLAQTLPQPPLAVVVSGYDDFGYAVEMFRSGVRDYILKPVDRAQFYAILQRLEAELTAGHKAAAGKQAALGPLLRAVMLADVADSGALRALEAEYGGLLPDSRYGVVCLRPGEDTAFGAAPLCVLPGMAGHLALLVAEAQLPALRRQALKGRCAGYSRLHTGLGGLHPAFREAVDARGWAFLRGQPVDAGDLPAAEDIQDPEALLRQVIQLLGAGSADAAKQVLGQVLLLAQNARMTPDGYAAAIARLLDGVAEAYRVFPAARDELAGYRALYRCENAFAHYMALCAWMDRFCARMQDAHEDESRKKIHAAIGYLQQHFCGEVNMAMVSNHVSMNYTQFSNLFKQYTGQNFLEYLKRLRLEESERLLRDTPLKVREVGLRAGFKNDKHFMKVFRQRYGVSPSAWRRNLARGEAPEGPQNAGPGAG